MGGGLQGDKDVIRRLANGDRELAKHLKDDFSRAAEDVAQKTRERILAAAAPKYPDRGLREEISRTVSVRGRVIQAGVQAEIKSDGELMPPGKWNLAAYANAGSARWRRWRHPVFARSDLLDRIDWVWVNQNWPSAAGWFDDTISHSAQEFSDAVREAVAETTAYLEGDS